MASGMAASNAVVLDGTQSKLRGLTGRLLSNPFFTSFDPEIVEVLAPHCSIEGFPAGATIMRKGDACGDVFVVDQGTAQVVLPVQEVDQLVVELGRGGVLGELSLILGEAHGATVIAKETLSLVRIPHGPFRAVISSDPRWPSALLKLVARKLKDTTEPLAHLCLVAENLVSDKFDPALLDALSRSGEGLGPLSQTFEAMVRYVTERAQRLEREVEERTRALSDEIARRQAVEEELRCLASTDPLTGVSNRRAFFEASERELKRAARYGRPVALMMLDIDHFKKVNDTHGHKAGDVVLKAFADCCHEGLRGQDLLGRLGGEEFAILAPECDAEAAAGVSERFRQSLARLRVSVEGLTDPISFTVSIGLIDCDPQEPIDHLLDKADKALYEAKRTGRNRVVRG